MNYFHCYLIFYRQNKKSKRIVDEYLSSIQEELFGIGVLHNNLKKSYEHKETLVKSKRNKKNYNIKRLLYLRNISYRK